MIGDMTDAIDGALCAFDIKPDRCAGEGGPESCRTEVEDSGFGVQGLGSKV